MKVALVTGPLWLRREAPTLRRLAVGLVGEMVRIVRVVPRWWAALGDDLSMTGDLLLYGGAGEALDWRWLRDRQIRNQAEALRHLEVDAVHVLDGTLRRVGLAMGEALGVPAVCSIWSRAEAEALSPEPPGRPMAYTAATVPLAELCRERLGEAATIRPVPPGVFSSSAEEFRPPLANPAQSLSCVVVGDGVMGEPYEGLLEGIARAKQQLPQAMYFFHVLSGEQHELWQAAARLDLLEQVCLVPFEPASRDLMVQADVMIQPECSGCAHTLVLEAMAAGRPVIAAADPLLDYLRDSETAHLLHKPGPADWAACLTRLAAEPEPLVRLGESARRYIHEHHSAAAFVENMLDLYRQVITPQPIPFTPGGEAGVR